MQDLLLLSAREPGRPAPVDILLRGGRIHRILPAGSRDPAGDSGAALRVDLGGRWVLPGLWDEHVHAGALALEGARLDLAGAASAREAARAVAAELLRAAPAPGFALVGIRFRDASWPDAPTRAMLDEAGAGAPVALISADLHCVWLNAAAGALYGVAVPEDGLLREAAAFALTEQLGSAPAALLDALLERTAAAAAARGVVGIVDLEMRWNIDPWRRRFDAGFSRLRIDAGVYAQDLERAAEAGLRSGRVLDERGLLRVGPMKVLTDGSLGTRTAYCSDPYPHGGSGLLEVPPERLRALLERCRETGFLPAVHAIGDAANTLALDAFEAVGIGGRIEHAQLLAERDRHRFGPLGVVASVQPEHALDDRDVAEENWAGRTGRAFVLRGLLDAGATLALGSDAPVARLDPWLAMSAATTRRRGDGRAPWHPEQSITRREALTASSRGRSRLRVGEPADLIVLEADPLGVPEEVFREMPVGATMVGGALTHGSLE